MRSKKSYYCSAMAHCEHQTLIEWSRLTHTRSIYEIMFRRRIATTTDTERQYCQIIGI